MIDYQGPAEEVLAKQSINDIVYETYSQLDIFLVLSRRYPDAPMMLKRLEAAANKLDIDEVLLLQ